jgi:hypothetical protein
MSLVLAAFLGFSFSYFGRKVQKPEATAISSNTLSALAGLHSSRCHFLETARTYRQYYLQLPHSNGFLSLKDTVLRMTLHLEAAGHPKPRIKVYAFLNMLIQHY